ncbi:MAG: hypothetical protein ABSG99_06400 [Sedimentisphaerales bacterium]
MCKHIITAEARENPASATTTTKLRDFIEQFVGPMVLKTDGTVTRKETPPSEEPEGGVTRPIAGAGFEPATSGLWARLVVL